MGLILEKKWVLFLVYIVIIIDDKFVCIRWDWYSFYGGFVFN